MLRNQMSGLVVAAVLAMAALVSNASAQMFGGGMRGAMEADFSSKDLELAAETLALNADQKLIAEELLKGYLVEWEELRGRMTQVMEGARQEFRETQDPTVWQDIQKVMGSFEDEKKQMTDRFLDDLKLTLTEEQQDRWPILERQRRRTKSLEQSFLSGEGVDVVELVRGMEWSPEIMESVTPILERYELELDRALVERNERYESGMERAMDLWQSQDWDTMETLFNEAREAGVRVRDTHRRAARQIMSVLPPDQAGAFEKAFKEESFPQVYRRSYAVRVFETTKEMSDLSEDQLSQIVELRAQLDRELGKINDAMAESIEKEEMERSVRGMMGMGRGGPGGDREARRQKRDFEMQMVERLKGMLTPEQQARLPEPEAQRDWRRGFGDRPRGAEEEGQNRPRRQRDGGAQGEQDED